MKEKLPTYLLEFPNEEFRKKLKQASIINDKSMKDFILETLEEKIDLALQYDKITKGRD